MLLFDFDQVLVDSEQFRHLRESRRWDQYRRLVSELDPCAGVDQLIHFTSSLGYQMAIVTQSPSFIPKLFVQKRNWPINNIVGWHDFKRPKPDPRCLQVAMQRGNAKPSDSYHIGDLPSDTEASRRAGVKSIGAGWAVSDKEALRRSKPDYYFNTVEELHDFIKAMKQASQSQ
ncbi:MAG: HAD hydrolase-like protein [Bacteroidota bacterium]|nr:HAD hydrolase-like protein [Bacteroidota bacterium]